MYKKKTILALVPARIGSKRIKKKNILPIHKKKTLLDFTHKSILDSKYLDRSILSTESKKIKNIAKKIGYEVPFLRPKKYASDNSSTENVIKHAIQKLKKNYDYVMVLQPTSPLRKGIDIDNSIKLIINNNCKCVISTFFSKKVGKFPVTLKKKKIVKFNFNLKKRNSYYLNGAIFLFKLKYFLKYPNINLIQKKNQAINYIMPISRSVDIDTESDLKIFKKYLKHVKVF